jgi:hypothetical protein
MNIRNNTDNNMFAQHILDTIHTHGPIEDTSEILHIVKKG